MDLFLPEISSQEAALQKISEKEISKTDPKSAICIVEVEIEKQFPTLFQNNSRPCRR